MKTGRMFPKSRDEITAQLTGTQYYCEYCEQAFEYAYPGQHGCERCNRAIQDNNIVERRYVA